MWKFDQSTNRGRDCFLFRECSSAIAYLLRNLTWSVGAQQGAQWIEIANSRRWISNKCGKKNVGCYRGMGYDGKSRIEKKIIIGTLAWFSREGHFQDSLSLSLFPFFFHWVVFARAFIKINFDADLLTVDLPTSKLDLEMDSNRSTPRSR